MSYIENVLKNQSLTAPATVAQFKRLSEEDKDHPAYSFSWRCLQSPNRSTQAIGTVFNGLYTGGLAGCQMSTNILGAMLRSDPNISWGNDVDAYAVNDFRKQMLSTYEGISFAEERKKPVTGTETVRGVPGIWVIAAPELRAVIIEKIGQAAFDRQVAYLEKYYEWRCNQEPVQMIHVRFPVEEPTQQELPELIK